MEWAQIIELVTIRRPRDSSINNKLRRFDEFVTVNLASFEWE